MLVCKYCLRREAVVRGEDGTIRGTVKVKGTLGRSAKCTYLKDLIIAHEECYLTVFLLTVNLSLFLLFAQTATQKREKSAGWTWGGLAELVKFSRVSLISLSLSLSHTFVACFVSNVVCDSCDYEVAETIFNKVEWLGSP